MIERKATLALGNRIVERERFRSQLEVCVSIGRHDIISEGKSPVYQQYINVYDSLVLRNLQNIGGEKEVEQFIRGVARQYGKIVGWELVFKHILQWTVDQTPPVAEETKYPFLALSPEARETFESSLYRNYLYAKMCNSIRRKVSVVRF